MNIDELLRDPLASPPPFNPIWDEDVDKTDGGEFRIYHTPDGDYPSVTSVLGYGEDHSWLDDWRARIGAEKADEISERSRDRGSAMHDLLERAVRRESLACPDGESIIMARALASRVWPRVGEYLGVEAALWSNRLRVAGRTDGIVTWDGRPAILDYKNARRVKKRDDVHGYFLQATIYAMMLFERTGLRCQDIVVAIACAEADLGKVVVFEEKTADWIDPALNKIRSFWSARDVI